jgi:hypothetical protein
MKSYFKYILSFVMSLLAFVIAMVLLDELGKGSTDPQMAFIHYGIVIIIAIMIGCTTLIITTIKENNK